MGLSFEFFPGRDAVSLQKLLETAQALADFAPKFMSVTFGAGGSNRDASFTTIKALQRAGHTVAAHLTCVGMNTRCIDSIADAYWQTGVRHIVALRGDPPRGESYKPHPQGYRYGADLVAGLKRIHDFEISVSAYPNRHPESLSWQAELDNLKCKADAGARRAITQFFFTPESFLRLRDRVDSAGISIELVPGILLQSDFTALQRMASLCDLEIPRFYKPLFTGMVQDKPVCGLVAMGLQTQLVLNLQREGVTDFHFYTLNRLSMAAAFGQLLHAGGIGKAA